MALLYSALSGASEGVVVLLVLLNVAICLVGIGLMASPVVLYPHFKRSRRWVLVLLPVLGVAIFSLILPLVEVVVIVDRYLSGRYPLEARASVAWVDLAVGLLGMLVVFAPFIAASLRWGSGLHRWVAARVQIVNG